MVENESDPDDSLAPELWPLLQEWRARLNLMGRVPLAAEIVPIIPARWRRQTALIVPGRRAGFHIQTCGFGLIRRFGRLADGDRISALAPGIRQPLGRRLLAVLRRRAPVVWRPAVALGRDPIRFSEVILPLLSEEGRGIDLLLLAAIEERRPRPPPPPPPDFYLPDWEQD